MPRLVTNLGYMLEHSEYPVVLAPQGRKDQGSDNPSGADNQQETASAGSSETARQAHSVERHDRIREGTVRSLRRRRELGRNDLTTTHGDAMPSERVGVTTCLR